MLLSLPILLPLFGLARAIPSDPATCPTLPSPDRTTPYTGGVDLAYCQKPKQQGTQLDGCPDGTIYVSQTDPQSDFGQISDAINAMPVDDSDQTILIGAGSYHDVVNITSLRTGSVTLLGMTRNPASSSDNLVSIWNSSFICQATQSSTQHNSDASVLTVDLGSHLSPPGVFRAHNLNFANRATWGNGSEAFGQTGPAAAAFFTWTNASIYNVELASYQDTLYVGRNSSLYAHKGVVTGGTDYIYGYGTAWFEKTTLANRDTGGGLVAWKGTDGYHYGVYINKGRVVKAKDALPWLDLTGTRALGRPWNNASRVIYQDTFMSDIVLPAGFIQWGETDPRVVANLTEFVEVGSHGPGFDLAARYDNSAIQRTVTKAEEAKGEVDGLKTHWSVEDVFGEPEPSWIDWAYISSLGE